LAASDWRMQGAAPTGLVEDGESIDLGDWALEIMHLPGRSPGGLARPSELPVRRVYPGHYGPFDAARMTILVETQLTDLSAHQYSERQA